MPELHGQKGIMWIVATADEPVTTREAADMMDVRHDAVGTYFRKLYVQGYLLRRRSGAGGVRKTEYEYVVAPREDDWE